MYGSRFPFLLPSLLVIVADLGSPAARVQNYIACFEGVVPSRSLVCKKCGVSVRA